MAYIHMLIIFHSLAGYYSNSHLWLASDASLCCPLVMFSNKYLCVFPPCCSSCLWGGLLIILNYFCPPSDKSSLLSFDMSLQKSPQQLNSWRTEKTAHQGGQNCLIVFFFCPGSCSTSTSCLMSYTWIVNCSRQGLLLFCTCTVLVQKGLGLWLQILCANNK